MEVDIVKYVLEGRCRVDDVIEWLTTVATPLPKVAASLNLGHGCNKTFSYPFYFHSPFSQLIK